MDFLTQKYAITVPEAFHKVGRRNMSCYINCIGYTNKRNVFTEINRSKGSVTRYLTGWPNLLHRFSKTCPLCYLARFAEGENRSIYPGMLFWESLKKASPWGWPGPRGRRKIKMKKFSPLGIYPPKDLIYLSAYRPTTFSPIFPGSPEFLHKPKNPWSYISPRASIKTVWGFFLNATLLN